MAKRKGEWDKAVMDMMQWTVDEAKRVCGDIEHTYRHKPGLEVQIALARAIHDAIRETLLKADREGKI
jgi:hypothetical protein